MTKKAIEALCKKNKLYLTPKLNDVLYLHYQGTQFLELPNKLDFKIYSFYS